MSESVIPSVLFWHFDDLVIFNDNSIIQVVVLETPAKELIRVSIYFFKLLSSEADRTAKINLEVAFRTELKKNIYKNG